MGAEHPQQLPGLQYRVALRIAGAIRAPTKDCTERRCASAGQLKRIANLMQSAGMEVPDWMRSLPKEKPHLKQLKRDKRKAAEAAVGGGQKGKKRKKKEKG